MNADAVLRMKNAWIQVYGPDSGSILEDLLDDLRAFRQEQSLESLPDGWYQDAVVYSLYVDLFDHDFSGLENRLEYLAGLGVNCIWLLPILDSPMRDAGFDIRDYRKIRHDLLGLPEKFTAEQQDAVFGRFLEKAHRKGIRVIFDIAINHTSEEHPWFTEARSSPANPYRDYYIWSKDASEYGDARIIFKGIEESNWKKEGDEFYFHRFFDFQPDLNYRNPKVLVEMSGNLLFWLKRGVDGFRADAIPYLWKEEGTACENLPQTHAVVRFFRALLDYVRPNTLLLAEACQKPHEVVKYFGDGDECNAGYHFPLMPQMFKAVAQESILPVKETLSLEVTPAIPENTQWFTFLRCHDELSLELVYVTEEDRKYIHDNYCRQPSWDFREGQGISARLAELMDRDPEKIGLIYSIMLTLPGTPVIYYGDEFGKFNDQDYYREMIGLVGKDDTRFLVRGRIEWDQVKEELADQSSFQARVFSQLSNMIRTRKRFRAFGRGTIAWLSIENAGHEDLQPIMAFIRQYHDERLLILHNLSGKQQKISIKETEDLPGKDLLGNNIITRGGQVVIGPHKYHWINLPKSK